MTLAAGKSERAVESTISTIARLILPAVLVVVLSISSWIAVRLTSSLDKHSDQLYSIEAKTVASQQLIDLMVQRLGDHESRLRLLERAQK